MKTKHTAGPWVVCINSVDQMISIEQDAESLGDSDGEPTIVVMCVDDMGEGLNREIGMANARLMAAAPDLLEVCCKMRTVCEEVTCGKYPQDVIDWARDILDALNASRAAITKAIG